MVISENCCTFIVLNYKVVQTIIAMFTEDKVTEIFFMADEFHKVFCRMLDKYSLNAPKMTGKRPYHRAGKLSVPEIMTIMILFHNSGYRCLKHFYLNEVCVNLRHLFPQGRLLQPLRGAGEGGGHTAHHLYQEGTLGKMHRHQFCRLHASACVQELAHPYP